MKKFYFLAAAILAAASCAREPIVPEEPVQKQVGPFSVTLVTGNPETRTELREVTEGTQKLLYPFWSEGDCISVITVPGSVDYNSIYSFSGELIDGGRKAKFTSQEGEFASFVACYPQPEKIYSDYGDYWDNNYGGWYYENPDIRFDGNEGTICFNVPNVQYPTPTSFDSAADFMVSEQFDITEDNVVFITDGEGDIIGGEAELEISFTRMNAIVKIVLQDETVDGLFDNQTVRSVTLSVKDPNQIDYGGGEIMPTATRTRADVWDNEDIVDWGGLAGYVYYYFPEIEGEDSYYVNNASQPAVTAVYTDDTYYIGEEGAATYLITVPRILKNGQNWQWDPDTYQEISTNSGLYVQVVTDKYVITRNITLPPGGIAFQPSRVTTLNIGLYDDQVNGTSVCENAIAFEKEEYTLLLNDDDLCWDSIKLFSKGFSFVDDAIDEIEWTLSADGITILYTGDASVNSKYSGAFDSSLDDIYIESDENCHVGTATLTASFRGITASCTIKVIAESPNISFTDNTVKSLCLEWDINGDGELNELEASKVDALTNFNTGDGESLIFVGNTSITLFNELRYFTGLETLENAFSHCSNLQSVQLPSTFTGDIAWAFYQCVNLVTVGDLPEGMTEIGDCAFDGCKQLENITLPSTIEAIGGSAFYGCEHLLSISLPEALRGIGDSAFRECKLLQSVSIPGGVGSISSKAFMNCTSLESVTLSEGLVGINENAFYNCGMHEITFPSTLKFVNTNSFARVPFLSGHDGYNGITFLGAKPIIYRYDNNYTEFSGSHWDSTLNGGEGDWSYGIQINVPSAYLSDYSNDPAIQNGGQNIIVGF